MLRGPSFIFAPIPLFLLIASHKPQIGKNDVFANGQVKRLRIIQTFLLFQTL